MIKYADLDAVCDKYNNVHLTYNELRLEIENFASGLQQLGVQKGDFVCLITENQGRWFICQQAIMKCGAIATLRGSNAPIDELSYIMDHSEAKGVILRDKDGVYYCSVSYSYMYAIDGTYDSKYMNDYMRRKEDE